MSDHWFQRLGRNIRRELSRFRRVVTLRTNGLSARFRVRPGTIRRRLTGLRLEDEQRAAFLDALRPDDVVYELGGHIGTWSVFLALATPQGELHVFEPEPGNRGELIGNLARNGLERVAVHALAASDANGTASFGVVGRLGDGRHSLLVRDKHQSTVEIETVRLDDFIARGELRPPTAIKIDIEGAEAAAVRGLEATLRARAPRVVFIEIHRLPGLEEGQAAMHRQLEESGYRVERSWDRGGEEQRLYVVQG
ncbi:MAG: FkbM family methyltransferase [Planctomycetota bacterium]